MQDYSAQWADYYRSLGMMKEAEMIESQARGSAAPPQPQAAPQPAMAGQPDYSAQWAEYYRSLGTVHSKYQCCGSMTFWCGSGSGSGSADPCLTNGS